MITLHNEFVLQMAEWGQKGWSRVKSYFKSDKEQETVENHDHTQPEEIGHLKKQCSESINLAIETIIFTLHLLTNNYQ